jgi:hypothetical protein
MSGMRRYPDGPGHVPEMHMYHESGDAMRIVRMISTYLIIILSVVGIGSYPPIV